MNPPAPPAPPRSSLLEPPPPATQTYSTFVADQFAFVAKVPDDVKV